MLPLVVLLLLSVPLTKAQDDGKSFATSVAAMRNLLDYEDKLIANLEEYSNELTNKARVVIRAVTEMRAEHSKAVANIDGYLANPLNSFRLLRRMHMDWNKWEVFMQKPVGTKQIHVIQQYRPKLPNDLDFSEAAEAISRLRQTYGLKQLDMANGILNGHQYDVKLAAIDCSAIASALMNDGHNSAAIFWAYAALQVFQDSDINSAVLQISRRSLSELYADLLFSQGRVKDALSMITNLIVDTPNDVNLLERRAFLQRKLIDPLNRPPVKAADVAPSAYERGCRGEFDNKLTGMLCYYNRTTTPFLSLAPLKIEVIHLNPYMVVYHDVINDKEIEHLKNLATPSLHRATVYSETEHKSVRAKGRTSQFAWFADNHTNVTRRINQRIQDMTGFDLSGSEMLQVMNYGLGGHYSTHMDWFNVSDDAEIIRLNGNRKATVLFYLSDVELGGSTVFPNLQISVKPRKGSAVIWYNLDNRGVGNPQTLHAACPVLYGDKWVCNKWIREKSQVFRLPCYKEG